MKDQIVNTKQNGCIYFKVITTGVRLIEKKYRFPCKRVVIRGDVTI